MSLFLLVNRRLDCDFSRIVIITHVRKFENTIYPDKIGKDMEAILPLRGTIIHEKTK